MKTVDYILTVNGDNCDDEYKVVRRTTTIKTFPHWTGNGNTVQVPEYEFEDLTGWMDWDLAKKARADFIAENTWVVSGVRKDKRFASNLDAHKSYFMTRFYLPENAEAYLAEQNKIHEGDDEYSFEMWKAEKNMIFTCPFGDSEHAC